MMKAKILIVDDEPDVSLYLTTILKQAGYAPTAVATVKAGLAAMAEDIPALVCLDIMIPKESGISLYRQMKADPRLAKVPVLIVSGVVPSSDSDFNTLIAEWDVPPPDDYLEKPIKVDEFLARVKALLSRRVSARPLRNKSHG